MRRTTTMLLVTCLLGSSAPLLGATGALATTEPGRRTVLQEAPTADALADGVVVAHRNGGLEVPEGSAAGAEQVLAAGVGVLDFDVRRLADGTPVVMHDAEVSRTSSTTGRVASMTRAQWGAARLDPGRWFRSGLPREPLLTTAQVLDRFRGRAVLVLEVKDRRALGRVAQEVTERDMRESVVVLSNDPEVVRDIADLGLHAQVWRNRDQLARDTAAQLAASGARTVQADVRADDDVFRRLVGSGLRVWAYGVSTRAQVARLRALGVVGFVTDTPRFLLGQTTAPGAPPAGAVLPRVGVRAGRGGAVVRLRVRTTVPALGYALPRARFALRVDGRSYVGRTDARGRAVVRVRVSGRTGRHPIRVRTGTTRVTSPDSHLQGLTLPGSRLVQGPRGYVRVRR